MCGWRAKACRCRRRTSPRICRRSGQNQTTDYNGFNNHMFCRGPKQETDYWETNRCMVHGRPRHKKKHSQIIMDLAAIRCVGGRTELNWTELNVVDLEMGYLSARKWGHGNWPETGRNQRIVATWINFLNPTFVWGSPMPYKSGFFLTKIDMRKPILVAPFYSSF